MSSVPNRAFVGRERELTELGAALERAVAGRGGLLLVVGEAGIGKTRLAAELATRAAATKARAIWGRCWEGEGRPPYWPWVQLVRTLVRERSVSLLDEALGARADHLAQLVPELRGPPARNAPATPALEGTRFDLFDAMASLVRHVATRTPLLLLLDDVHLADLPSLSLLEFLSHQLADARILVVGTYRPVESRKEPAIACLLGLLGRAGAHLPLVGFSEDEVGRYMTATAGRPVPGGLVRRIHQETEGNPLFVDEMVRVLEAGGEAGRWALPGAAALPMPQGIRGAIRQRLAPLTSACRGILAAASVVGREFDIGIVAALCDMPRNLLLDRLEAAVDHEIVARVPHTSGRYRLSHALVREMLYGELPPAERVRLHRRVALLLEARRGEPRDRRLPQLAHHFFEAAADGDDEKAIGYVEQAGHQAMVMLAFEEAAEQYRRVLHLLERSGRGGARECELLIALGEAQSRAGRQDEASQTLRRAAALARELGSGRLLADTALRLCDVSGLFWTEFGRTDDWLVRILEEALTALDPAEAALRASVLARLATELVWRGPSGQSEALGREAVALARRADDRKVLAYTLLARILCASGPDTIDERAAIVSEVLALSEATGQRELAVNALMWRVGDALHLGDASTMLTARAALIQLVRDLRQPADLWMIPTMQSQGALLEGRFAEAERLSEAILTEPTRWANAAPMASALLFLVRREQGRLGEIEGALKSLVPEHPDVLVWRASLVLLYAEVGRLPEARIELATLLRAGLDTLRRDLTWLYSLACLVEACVVAGSPNGEAAMLYDALLPFADRNVVAGPAFYVGPVSYYLGRLAACLGRDAEAASHFTAAREQCERLGAQPWLARVLFARASWCARRSGPEPRAQALALLGEALEIARRLGMHALRDRGEALDHELALPSRAAAPPAATAGRRAALRCEGEIWALSFGGRVFRLRDGKGLRYLARLLREPGREFHVLDLVGSACGPAGPARGARAADGERASVVDVGDAGFRLDEQAKRAYRGRLHALRLARDDAERDNDFARATAARAEIDALSQELASAVGLGGRHRRMGAAAERARASVTKALRTAIGRIGTNDPVLADLLDKSIRTGTFCGYQPPADSTLAWDL